MTQWWRERSAIGGSPYSRRAIRAGSHDQRPVRAVVGAGDRALVLKRCNRLAAGIPNLRRFIPAGAEHLPAIGTEADALDPVRVAHRRNLAQRPVAIDQRRNQTAR